MEAACPDAATPSVEGGVASVFAGEGSFSTADADAAESGSTTDAAAVALGSTTDAAAAESGVGSAGGSAVTTVTFISASAAAAGGTTCSVVFGGAAEAPERSEEHTSALQSLMRTSYAVSCLIKKMQQEQTITYPHTQN